MKYFKIGYGCGCSSNEDYITAKDQKEANATAWEYAVEEYESFEGLHGIRGMYDIAEEDYGINLNDADEATYDDIERDYLDERESQLDYWAEEITEKEYLIGIGELEDDDYDPYTGKYAFCPPSNSDLGFGENWVSESPEMPDEDREVAEAAQEAHDNLIRSLVEAGGEIREARELLVRALDQLYLLGYDSGFTNPAIEQLATDIKFYLNGGELNGSR